jgi:ribonuclease Z
VTVIECRRIGWVAVVVLALGAGPHAARQTADPGLFRITLLGTGNPRPSAERFGPSTLVEVGGKRVLIDVGRGASIRLFQLGSAEFVRGLDAVFFTHLHSDHVVGFPDLWLTAWVFGRALPLPVLGPPGTVAMLGHLRQAYAFDLQVRSKDEGFPAAGIATAGRDIAPGVVLDVDGVKVTAFRVDHGPVAEPAYGYRVDFGSRSAAFSGDARYMEEMVGYARGVDVLVHEVLSPEVERRRARVVDPGAIERIIARHTTPEDAGRLFARIRPRLAVYSHIVPSPATPEDLIAPTRKTYDGPLEVGHDLMRITIGDRVTVETLQPPPDR